MPITIYSLTFGIYKIFDTTGAWEYNNLYCWVAILLISVLYPLNQVGLFMLFWPLENLFESKIVSAAKSAGKYDKENPILIGNFGPIDKEQSYEVVNVVAGKVPTDISGVYLRNGPNSMYIPENKQTHWFDGDAMIHALRIKDGKMFYCNRYVECKRLQKEREAGKAVFIRIGEMSFKAGIFKMLLH